MERRSPCLTCEFKNQSKLQCCENCEKLKEFQDYLLREHSPLATNLLTSEPPACGRKKGPDIARGGSEKMVKDKLLEKLKEKGIGHRTTIPRKIKREIKKIQEEEKKREN